MIKLNFSSKRCLFGIIILVLLAAGCTGEPKTTEGQAISKALPTATISPTPETATLPTPTSTTEITVEITQSGPVEPQPTSTPAQENLNAPTASPTNTGNPPIPEVILPKDCINQAVFIADVTIPDDMIIAPNTTFDKTWRVKNSGTCNWEGYTLAFAGGDILNTPLNNPIPNVHAGEQADLTLTMRSPERGGAKYSDWVFQDEVGNQFGLGLTGEGKLWARINVTWVSNAPSSPGTNNPETTSTSTSNSISAAGCAVSRNQSYENQVLSLINNARALNGLPPLGLNGQLSAAALSHSTDMACNRFVDHNGSDGSTWYQRVAAQGYSNSASARENIYVGDPAFGGTPQGAVEWWMNSQVHRDNILNIEINEVGIGYVYLTGSEYGGYYTLVFAKSY